MTTLCKPRHLWWLDLKTKKRTFAGQAYYDENSGDYSLVINLFEISHQHRRPVEIYLRPLLSQGSTKTFRLEKLVYRRGKQKKINIGEAYSNKETDGDILINLEPLTSEVKKLVLIVPKGQEVKNESNQAA